MLDRVHGRPPFPLRGYRAPGFGSVETGCFGSGEWASGSGFRIPDVEVRGELRAAGILVACLRWFVIDLMHRLVLPESALWGAEWHLRNLRPERTSWLSVFSCNSRHFGEFLLYFQHKIFL